MTELLFIRHGQTDWNLDNRYQGTVDIPLNETGRRQAQQLALAFAPIELAAIYSSHLSRAKETAEIIQAGRPIPLGVYEGLKELHFGELEGKTIEEVSQLHAAEISYLRQLPASERLAYKFVPGQESGPEAIARTLPVLQEIAQTHPNQRVLIVTHGGVIRTLLIHFAQFSWEETNIPNGQAALFRWNGSELKLIAFPFFN